IHPSLFQRISKISSSSGIANSPPFEGCIHISRARPLASLRSQFQYCAAHDKKLPRQ
ncbi:hypothetical protein M378DRAFT_167072, partial [Amanita muscaria Koide BX008]